MPQVMKNRIKFSLEILEKDGGYMKFLHTGDLHIGKSVNEFSMLEDQRHILKQIQEIALDEKAEVIVIAGDIYDRSIPSGEAVELLDAFLTGVLADGLSVVMISGNHDSPQRVKFADRILEKQGLYIAGGYDGRLKKAVFADAYGSVEFICLPFVKPAEAGEANSARAVEHILAESLPEGAEGSRRVLVTHFFVTGEGGVEPELSDSETTVHVGGLDNVPVTLFQEFDYVALGHIHKPQQIGKGHVYYAGAPLKYSFSEARGEKYVNIVTMGVKGETEVKKRALTPLREMRILKGRLEELLEAGRAAVRTAEAQKAKAENQVNAGDAAGKETAQNTFFASTDYIQAVLTDKEELIDPIGSLRSVYPNVMQIILEKNLSGPEKECATRTSPGRKTIEELFSDFYEMLKEEPLDDKRKRIVAETAEEARKERGLCK